MTTPAPRARPVGDRLPHAEDQTRRTEWWGPVRTGRLVVSSRQVSAPDDREFTQYAVGHELAHRGVVVIPYSADGSVVLVPVWRPVVGTELYEAPRGFGESDDLFENARRELEEETGLRPLSMTDGGEVYPENGWVTDVVAIVFAQVGDLTPHVGTSDDATEVGEARRFTAEELDRAVAEGEIVDGFTLSGIARLAAYGRTGKLPAAG